jgi:hypothetical protein
LTQYWDSITKEDLEFSVGSKQAVWEVKESLLRGDEDDSPGLQGGQGGYGQYGGQGGQQGYPPVPTKYGGDRSYGY